MTPLQWALDLVNNAWNAASLLPLPMDWFGFGVGIEGTAAHPVGTLVIFSRTELMPPVLGPILDAISTGVGITTPFGDLAVRIVPTGGFASLGGGGAVRSPRISAGDGVISSWTNAGGRKAGGIGTIAAFLRKPDDPQPWLLSANHVIGMNCDAFHPDLRVHLANDNLPGEVIGSRVACIPITGEPCSADAAVVRLDIPWSRISLAHPAGLRDSASLKVSLATAKGINLRKKGIGSGPTFSSITAINATVVVDMTDEIRGNVHLTNQIVAAPFAQPGDSGSLAVDAATGRAVGLVVARGKQEPKENQVTVISPITAVLDGLATTGRFTIAVSA